jgi:hypothetical protein
MNQEIYDNYTTPGHPTAFSSPGNLKRHYENRYGTKPILDTLQHIDTYTTHREFKKPRVSNPFYMYEKRQQVQIDLIDMARIKKYNKGVTFILTAIDNFTKMAWARQLTNKSAAQTLPAIRSILEAMGEKPKSIFCDSGKEFKNTLVHTYLRHEGVQIIHAKSEKKAPIVERFNKTIQGLIYRYLTKNQTETFTDKLQHLMHTYNTRKHNTIKMTPHDAEKPENQQRLLAVHNERYTKIGAKRKKPKYSVGTRVLVKNLPENRFHRGYHQSFRLEQFEIVEVNTRMPIPMYKLKSLNKNDVIEGGFYAEELQEIKGDVFKVEKVLKKRKYRGKTQLFVRWVGFDQTHDSWIDEEDVVERFREGEETDSN